MAVVKDWMEEAARLICRRVVPDGDRSDAQKIVHAIEEACPFKRDRIYMSTSESAAAAAEFILFCAPAETKKLLLGEGIVLLPAIPGHAHKIGLHGEPTCGCSYTIGKLLPPAPLQLPEVIRDANAAYDEAFPVSETVAETVIAPVVSPPPAPSEPASSPTSSVVPTAKDLVTGKVG